MTPDWLAEIEARAKRDTSDEWWEPSTCHSRDALQLVSALKLAIEGLEFYRNHEQMNDGSWSISNDCFSGKKAREILEKIQRGEG